MSSRISVIKGSAKTVTVDLVDGDGQRMTSDQLTGAVSAFVLRVLPTDMSNVLTFGSNTTPSRLSVSAYEATVTLALTDEDTATLVVGEYFYRMTLTLANGDIIDIIPWAPSDVSLGGSATPEPPVFDATIKVDHDFMLSGDLAYKTAGGSPIENAQVRVYKKSDYDAGLFNAPAGITTTDARGNWRQPIFVEPGYDFVVRFEKPYEYGPDVRVITAV